eukprot:1294780-Rhodomonas_salina.1
MCGHVRTGSPLELIGADGCRRRVQGLRGTVPTELLCDPPYHPMECSDIPCIILRPCYDIPRIILRRCYAISCIILSRRLSPTVSSSGLWCRAGPCAVLRSAILLPGVQDAPCQARRCRVKTGGTWWEVGKRKREREKRRRNGGG